MIIAGAGGFGREVISLLIGQGRTVTGVVDDGSPDVELLEALDVTLLGRIDDAANHGDEFVAAIGYPQPRSAVAQRLEALGLHPCQAVVHASAVQLPMVELGAGTVVMPNTTISTNTRVGRHGLINYNASIGHDCVLGEVVTIGPNAAIGGGCRIGDRVLVGSGAVILQGISIGDGAIIGSGAVVIADVAAGAAVVGVPARPIN